MDASARRSARNFSLPRWVKGFSLLLLALLLLLPMVASADDAAADEEASSSEVDLADDGSADDTAEVMAEYTVTPLVSLLAAAGVDVRVLSDRVWDAMTAAEVELEHLGLFAPEPAPEGDVLLQVALWRASSDLWQAATEAVRGPVDACFAGIREMLSGCLSPLGAEVSLAMAEGMSSPDSAPAMLQSLLRHEELFGSSAASQAQAVDIIDVFVDRIWGRLLPPPEYSSRDLSTRASEIMSSTRPDVRAIVPDVEASAGGGLVPDVRMGSVIPDTPGAGTDPDRPAPPISPAPGDGGGR